MNIPQVSTAFCGQCLRTASLIIAWSLTISVGIVWSLYLSLLPVIFKEYDFSYGRGFQAFFSILGMILTYFFIEHCLLLWGVLKKQQYFLLPWIVVTCLTISLGICAAAVLLIMALVESPVALLFFVPNSLFTSGLIYCLLVIYSYYQEISNNSNTQYSAVQVI
ncbi:unnamed protein product [Nezara viridula]|uniref:Uncharacterized protein n=1 Tax=Nezara viridula TaxID=85310 RepID=A0A9P0E8M6_NEZVI|nr:unnamed protein product [Nezara viridula]